MKNQKIYLEHANITANSIKECVHFFQSAFPHFEIRGGDDDLKEWIHLGDDNTYIAINKAQSNLDKFEKDYAKIGINHIGFVVENVNEIAERLLAAGYKRDYPRQEEKFRIREYFADGDSNQYEFVQYLSDKIEEKNLYN